MYAKTGFNLSNLIRPKSLMFAAGVFAVAGSVSLYLHAAERAETVLALRLGPPEMVAIQNFTNADAGPAREVNLLTEADFSRAVVVPPADGGDMADYVVPLFARDGSGAVLGLMHAPLPSDARVLPEVRDLVSAAAEAGKNGTVVNLNGVIVDDTDWSESAVTALGASGLLITDSVLHVRTFAGERAAYFSQRSGNAYIKLFFLLAAGLVMVAAGQAFREPSVTTAERDDGAAPDGAAIRHDPRFTPLPTQDEIFAEEARTDGDRPTRVRSSVVADVVMSAVDLFRNRRLRSEDEAL